MRPEQLSRKRKKISDEILRLQDCILDLSRKISLLKSENVTLRKDSNDNREEIDRLRTYLKISKDDLRRRI